MSYFAAFEGLKDVGKAILEDMEIGEEEDCGNDDVTENGIFDKLLLSPDLPDDLFDEYIEIYKGDPCINVLNTHNVVNDVVCSKICHIDYATETVQLGSRDLDPLLYYIDHDLNFSVPGIRWFVETFYFNRHIDFPYIHPAQVHIDRAKTRPEAHYQIQHHMMQNGYYLYEPTALERKHCSTYGGLMTKYVGGEDDIPYTSSKKVFLSYRDKPSEITGDYVAMQFNPFHARSVSMIKNVERVGMVYKGDYEWKGRLINFEYDLTDTRYRIHSNEWQQFIGFRNVAYEVFDLVSNHDFLDVFSDGVDLRNNNVDDLTAALFIEPFVTNRRPKKGYSVIGPWPGEIRRGVAFTTYVPTMANPIESLESRDYDEVTHLTQDMGSSISVRNHCLECVSMKMYSDERLCPNCDEGKVLYTQYSYENSENYYVTFHPFRVFVGYVNPQDVGKGTYVFFRFQGLLPTYPRNGKESLMYEPRFLNLIDFFKVRRWHPEVTEFAAVTMHRMKSQAGALSKSVVLVDGYEDDQYFENRLAELNENVIYYFKEYGDTFVESVRTLFLSKVEELSDGVNVNVIPKEHDRFKAFLSQRDEVPIIL